MYRVHRATVARWIATLRGTLLERTREALVSRLRLSPAELDSVLRLIDSHLEVGLEGALSDED